MYDWANSAYITIAVGLLPVYFATAIIGPGGLTWRGTRYEADTLWAVLVGTSDLIAFVCAPVLGAIADFSAAKKRFLLFFTYVGSLAATLLYLSHTGDVYRTMVLFVIAQVCFTNANVVYDAFLPQIASPEKMDWVSGKGYSYGYVGGGLQFALALLLVVGHQRLGISQELAARIGIATAGLWWGGFTLYTARYLKEAPSREVLPERYRNWPRPLAFVAVGVSRTLRTTLRVRRFRHLALFLVAFMLYNDGIQTVINLATTYGTVELKLPVWVLMGTLLVIQVVATFGALAFSRLAGRIGTKPAIMTTLLLWTGVVAYAYFIHSATEFFILGVVVGVVLGGSQSLSRSFYGSMVPEAASAEFFGFYTVFTKFSSVFGPLLFAVIKQTAGSSRLAILSLVVFFVVGLVLLALVNETKARQARLEAAF
jgi:UMF1 family MFS transporter